MIAGIAAGLQPEIIKLSDLSQDKPYSSELTLDNKWIATLAGKDIYMYTPLIFHIKSFNLKRKIILLFLSLLLLLIS